MKNNSYTKNHLLTNILQNFPLYKMLEHIKTISINYRKEVGFSLQTTLIALKLFLK